MFPKNSKYTMDYSLRSIFDVIFLFTYLFLHRPMELVLNLSFMYLIECKDEKVEVSTSKIMEGESIWYDTVV